ncbi:MAG: hypothetical protein KZQ88_09445 [Candidatus Thiodiazotropha sp. (ex Dulcina madagascariensis)]|nr:hypothetical protein [Candidatus Thiodiazotropha sp. (ex Dulcina madagascariensis)]MCU7925002.1 hypothetical protein [Candidatus Thiodiazotropha sp. (ex Dulcina madagascariensis)]
MKRRHLALIPLSLLMAATGVQALGLRLLEFSPVKYFTAEDWASAKATAAKALKQGKDGEKFAWKNPATGHKGAYTVLNTLQLEGQDCRDLRIKHFAGGVNGGGTYRFCQTADGKWQTQGSVQVK